MNSMELSGWSVLNCSPISVKVFFRDAAAKTVIDGPGAVSDEPQLVNAATSVVVDSAAPIRTRFMSQTLGDASDRVRIVSFPGFASATVQ